MTKVISPASFFNGVQCVANFSKPMYLLVHMVRSMEMALPILNAVRTRDLYSLDSLEGECNDSQRKTSMPMICEIELLGIWRAG